MVIRKSMSILSIYELEVLSIYELESDKESDIAFMTKVGYKLDKSGSRKFSKEELLDLCNNSRFKPDTDYLYCIYKKKESVSENI